MSTIYKLTLFTNAIEGKKRKRKTAKRLMMMVLKAKQNTKMKTRIQVFLIWFGSDQEEK